MNAIARGFRAVFVEHRLPYRVAQVWDNFARRMGFAQKTITAEGYRVRVRRQTCDEDFVRNIILEGEYTPEGYTPTGTVIDIGANIGCFSLLASRTADKVLSFEPEVANFALLETNLATNRVVNVQAHRQAVSGQAGTVRLYTASQGGFHSVLAERGGETFQDVPAVTLASIMDRYNVHSCFLKLDCEGAEYEILYHLPDSYWPRITRLVMEWHGSENPETRHKQAKELLNHLESHGLTIDHFSEFPPPFRGGHIRARR